MTRLLAHHPRRKLSLMAAQTYRYIVREAPKRGGFMFEGARPVYESGGYRDPVIDELLATGAIRPHKDPKKGWIPVTYDPACEDLAEGFVEAHHSRLLEAGYTPAELDELRRDLARAVQATIEDWFAVLDDEVEAKKQARTDQAAANDDGEGRR